MHGCRVCLTKKRKLESWLAGDSATLGNFGDCKPVGEGVSEMRIHVGAGYRVYYIRTGSTLYVLLVGGDKSSQAKDISRAKKMARELKETKQ